MKIFINYMTYNNFDEVFKKLKNV